MLVHIPPHKKLPRAPPLSVLLTSLLPDPLWYLAMDKCVPAGCPLCVWSANPLRLDKLVLSLVLPTLGKCLGRPVLGIPLPRPVCLDVLADLEA